jgi:hypothetical protein
MSKLSVSSIGFTALLLASSAAHAAGTFPSAAIEFPPSLYTEDARNVAAMDGGGARAAFPTAAVEHGISIEYIEVRSGGVQPGVAGSTGSVFPSAAHEV